jgi:rubredoxin
MEVFMKYVCTVCGFVYDEDKGLPEMGIKAGTKFASFPDDWVCPLCGSPKSAFMPVEEEKEDKSEKIAETKSGEKMREMSYGELSIMCSSLALGCDKEQLARQKELFLQLSEYFKSKAGTEEKGDFSVLLEKISQNLSEDIPEAKKAAEDAHDRGAKRVLVWSEKATNLLKALVSQYQKEGIKMLKETKVWVCEICGFVYVGDVPPAVCPICKVPSFKILSIERK